MTETKTTDPRKQSTVPTDEPDARQPGDGPAVGDNRRAGDPDGNRSAGDGKAPGVTKEPEDAE